MMDWLEDSIPGASLNRLSDLKKASKSESPDDQDNEGSTSASSTVMSESAPHWAEFFEPDPWRDDLKPPLKFMDLEAPDWDDEEAEGILSDRMIEAGLSFPSPSPLLYHYSMTKLQLSGKNLDNIYKIADYKYLQYIDLSRNNLDDLTPLGNLPFLMYLDVSYNNLSYVLPFAAPLKLTYVNYSNNKVAFIDDLTDFWSLMKLDLSHNSISTIEGLQNLRYLRVLDLSFNNIQRFENLSHLRLTHLYLQNNQISEFEEGDEYGMKTIHHLQYVNLDNNKLKSLVLFEESYSLMNVSLIGNEISEVFEMENLKSSITLKELNLLGNPVVEWPEYRGMVISTVPSLRVLDGIPVESNEKVSAKNTFDPDIRIIAARNHDLLTIMEQLNNAVIDPCIFPVDEPPLPIIILVGPVASMKGELTRYIVERFPDKVSPALWHTSRPQREDEIDGHHYHYVTKDKINELAHSGAFVAYTEILGESYGLDKSELTKALEKKCLCISHTDMVGARAIFNRGFKPHIIFTISQSEELHLQRLLKKDYIAYRCSQEQCFKKRQCKEDEMITDQPRSTIHFIESLFTDSFLNNIAEGQLPEAKLNLNNDEEISNIPQSTINNFASLVTDEILSAVAEREEAKAALKTMDEELDAATLEARTQEYIESLLTNSLLRKLTEKQEDDDGRQGGNTLHFVESMIEDQLWQRLIGKKRGQMDEKEEKETTKYINSLIQASLTKHLSEIQKSAMKKEEIDEIENLIRDTLLKRLTKSLKESCHCISEENLEEEERKLSQETFKYIRSLIADHVTKHIADEKISNLPRETIKYVETVIADQLAKHLIEAPKPEETLSPEEIMTKIKRSTAEFIAISALFTDSFLIANQEGPKTEYLGTIEEEEEENEEKISNLPRETIKYIESLLADRSFKRIDKQERLKGQVRKKKITCPECDFAILCVKLVLESRQFYFKLCEQNRDFFSSIIYTDDMNEAYRLLSSVVKEVYRSRPLMPPIFSEEHERFKSSLSDKLNFYMSEINKHHHIYEEEKSTNQDCPKS